WIDIDDGNANAMSACLVSALAACVAEAFDDEAVNVLALRGRSEAFLSGPDTRRLPGGAVDAAALLADVARLAATLRTGPKPVLAVCAGPTVGIAAALLATADARIGLSPWATVSFHPSAQATTLAPWMMALALERMNPAYVNRAMVLAECLD